MKIVTSGRTYIDIDAYAGCIAYAELLQKQGFAAQAVSTAMPNESITPSIRAWNAPLTTAYTPNSEDTFTLIDLSGPEAFEGFVDLERIDEIIDHHPGMEAYWQQRLGDRAIIEQVGAACTQVYEKWQAAKLFEQMSETSARLLVCGILDNTLNFGAKITTDRDRQAYQALLTRANLPADWSARYFKECQAAILNNPAAALTNDSKTIHFKTFTESMRVGQLALWDGAELAQQQLDAFEAVLLQDTPHWFVNVISIAEGKSYLVTKNAAVQAWLSSLLDVTFKDNVAVADRMWLRKEIMYQDQQTVEL